MARGSTGLVVDLRGLDSPLRRPLVFCLIDKLVAERCGNSVVLVTEHEPAGLVYQIDLRRETRGRFESTYDQRSDGAWVCILKPKAVRD